jgi:hypothetical protein
MVPRPPAFSWPRKIAGPLESLRGEAFAESLQQPYGTTTVYSADYQGTGAVVCLCGLASVVRRTDGFLLITPALATEASRIVVRNFIS